MFSFFRAFWQRCLIIELSIILLCSACAPHDGSRIKGIFEERFLASLPLELRSSTVQLEQILNAYDNLNDRQRAAALEHFLSKNHLVADERQQASYMLGRIYEKNLENSDPNSVIRKQECRQAITLFNMAGEYPALKVRSLWHLIAVATICGEEKLIRQKFNEMLSGKNEHVNLAAIQYGLAQSYLRTYENPQAVNILEKIRLEFPHSDYALGAGYYLATLQYSQFEADSKSVDEVKRDNVKKQISSLFKTILPFYLEYLQASPSGRFAEDILAKIASLNDRYKLYLKENECATIGNAYFVNGSVASALSWWQKANPATHSFEIAECLLRQGRIEAAQQCLFRSLEKYPKDERYFSIALLISEKLTRAESLKFWSKLHDSKFAHQDQVLWNIAIREPYPVALISYQELLKYYPVSIYAPEAQWRLLWQKFKTTPAHSMHSLVELYIKAANKYNQSKLAPKFLYWTAKIFQILGNQQQANFYYEKTRTDYPQDYYAQRSNAQLAAVQGIRRDDYFALPQSLSNSLQSWNCPYPEMAIEQIKSKHEDVLLTLVHLKQYDEALGESKDAPAELVSWLFTKNAQPLRAINTAAKQIQDDRHLANNSAQMAKLVIWQYAYPLLYSEQISRECRQSGITDPLLMQALIREESRYNLFAVSQSNALGLCQLMPSTAKSVAKKLGVTFNSNNDLFRADLNIKLGVVYLSSVLQAFHGNSLLAIASYNAGANAVKSRIADKEHFIITDADFFVEDFPYRETREYIRKVFSSYWLYRKIYSEAK